MAILPVTTICNGPCLRLTGVSFFADITTVIKITHAQVSVQHYIYQHIYNTKIHSCELHYNVINISMKYVFPVATNNNGLENLQEIMHRS